MRDIIDLVEASNRPKTLEVVALPYASDALAPVLSEKNMNDHYGVLYKNYVKRFNEGQGDRDFNRAGAFLHERLFAQFCKPSPGSRPRNEIGDLIDRKFRTFDDFKDQFTETAMSIQGSGWCYLSTAGDIKVIRNHAVRTDIALICDMWEHQYIDYGPDKEKYLNNFWRIIDWNVINQRL